MKMVDFKRSVLLIVDMEYGFLDSKSPLFVNLGFEIVTNIKKILNIYREKKLPIIFVKREHRKSGIDIDKTRVEIFKKSKGLILENDKSSEIIDDLKPLKDEIIVIKRRWSSFFGTELDILLRRLNIKNLIVTGIQTPNCIRATVYDALSLDYNVIVISDATASKSEEIQKNNLFDIENLGVDILTTDELIDILERFKF
ncbi:MAG TPA: cysteine hydrolase [Caldisericia bacterium]|nr:cysteine hydrolase [Caldisericia bacterium]HQL66399.1 cysteine hydrolase [Caldisericia bacterium]HQN47870.1 cysteine hydrolase [Caldisericia bacterium]